MLHFSGLSDDTLNRASVSIWPICWLNVEHEIIHFILSVQSLGFEGMKIKDYNYNQIFYAVLAFYEIVKQGTYFWVEHINEMCPEILDSFRSILYSNKKSKRHDSTNMNLIW